MKETTSKRPASILIMTVVVLFVAGGILFYNQGDYNGEHDFFNVHGEELPVVGSYEAFKQLLSERFSSDGLYYKENAIMMLGEVEESVMFDDAGMAPSADDSRSVASNEGQSYAGGQNDYSETNVQVQGVDEADIVKTDGRHIFYIKDNKISVVKAYPPDEMEILETIVFERSGFTPREMFIDDKYLVVIGNAWPEVPIYGDTRRDGGLIKPEAGIMIHPPPYYQTGTMSIMIYEALDRKNIKLLREIDLEGSYVSSRKIGDALYFVANKHLDHYHIMDDILKEENAKYDNSFTPYYNITPSYRDTAVDDEFKEVGFDEIMYFPDFSEPNYLMVGGINLQRLDEKVEVHTYLGSGQNVYSSPDNLFVAVTVYEGDSNNMTWQGFNKSTNVYRFSLNDGQVDYTGKGNVPGTILNQFSMDEYKGHFRIATTTGDFWRTDEGTSRNNIYILGEDLNTVGKIEDIAPGERIYSVRYMGERGYMVTFRTVDPLFVIDLKDPQNPKILGELKIPGYSDYLHPYDENHLIGFGKEALEVTSTDWQGKPTTIALEQGMKVALFDVSDVNNPVEKFNEVIGGRGSDSELLRNHRALLFNKERDILAFPVTVYSDEMSGSQSGSQEDIPFFSSYEKFEFQGAYVYSIDIDEGFRLRGKISHLDQNDYREANNYYWYGSDKYIERILYIGDYLYTLSGSEIRSSDLDTLKKIKGLNLGG